MEYNFSKIEAEWKKYWAENNVYKVSNPAEGEVAKPKYYVLDMFPYPSGAGLHVGHPLGYIASDIYSRYKRMMGYNVLHPMGFDAFGLPAEQYALETGQHPAVTTEKNIARYKEQLDNIGFCYDWSREVRTSDPAYYKWTQWIFLQLFHSWYDRSQQKARPISELEDILAKEGNVNHVCPENNELKFNADEWVAFSHNEKRNVLMQYRLAYQGYAQVWWCEALGTVLANDEVVNGLSERGGHPVERKNMRQWFLRITEYADRLLSSLDNLDWSDAMKEMQRNWIGKSSGAMVEFKTATRRVSVFTTRPDTIFGVDFLVLAPEHLLVDEITTTEQKDAIDNYRTYVKSRSERERMAEVKQVTGCFTGGYAIHPLNNNLVPVWISEYVLAGYGTGAIMGVPSGDERDNRFAQHFGLPITNIFSDKFNGTDAYSEKTGTIHNSGFITGMEIKDAAEAVIDTLEKLELGSRKVNYRLRDAGFSRQRYWGEPFPVVYVDNIPYGTDETTPAGTLPVELPHVEHYTPGPEGQGPLANVEEWVNILASPPAPLHEWRGVKLSDAEGSATSRTETQFSRVPKYSIKVQHPFETARLLRKNLTEAENILWQQLRGGKIGWKFRRQHPIDAFFADFVCLTEALIVELDGGYHNDPVQKKLDNERTKTLEDIGFKVIRFTNEQVLTDINSVIANIKLHLNNTVTATDNVSRGVNGNDVTPSPFMEKGPGVEAQRETNTMPGYAGSSWYFLRYMDPHNNTTFADRKATDYWNQVDLYVGGTEHAVGHLLYSRMWTKALHDLGHIGFDEPFKKLLNQGMIQGKSYFVGTYKWLKNEENNGITFYSSYQHEEQHIGQDGIDYEYLGQVGRLWKADNVRLKYAHLFADVKDRLTKSQFAALVQYNKESNAAAASETPIFWEDSLSETGEQYIQCKMEVEKMSKSKYNVVNPDDIVAQYGADTFRMYEMFLGPIDVSKPWDTKGIEGVHRFLKKLWRLYADEQQGWVVTDETPTDAELRILHKTIKKVSDDIERFSFNTSVSQFMIAVNELSALGCHKRAILEPLALLICPFAPHIAEELWHSLGHTSTVVAATFPQFDEKYVTDNSKKYPVAINGKTRAEMEFPLDAAEADVKATVLADATIQKWLEGKEPKKFIYIKGKMINVVV